MEFIIGIPLVQGIYCLYMVVDRLTKFTHFFAFSLDYSETQVGKLFFREVFRLHVLPKTIVSDRDSKFIRAFWQDFSG